MKIKGQIQFHKLIKSQIDDYLLNCNFTETGSPSEKQCFIMRCKGYSPQYIATEACVSVETVYRVIRSIRRKIEEYTNFIINNSISIPAFYGVC